MSERVKGTVKFFRKDRGYGFVKIDDSTKEIFVHYSAIEGEGYRELYENERVEFEVEESDRGPRAANVKKLGAASTDDANMDEVSTDDASTDDASTDDADTDDASTDDASTDDASTDDASTDDGDSWDEA